MNAEIIAVGSELLLGQIVNTNARFISKHLADAGINVFYHSVVGDNPGRLKSVLEVAERRSNIIIFTGGLGPTKDDLTKETIAAHIGTELVLDDDAFRWIEEFYAKTGMEMTENNRKQALVLKGSQVLKNEHGMAPGMLLDTGKRIYMLLPGPPKEMEPMFSKYALPALLSKLNMQEKLVSRVIRFFGISEALLEAKVQDIIDQQSNPTIAPLAAEWDVTLRLTAKHSSIETALQLIDETEKLILERVGEYKYGYDDTSLMKELTKVLKQNGLTISCAESLTGGLFQQELTSIPGTTDILKGGVVCYTRESKEKVLLVQKETIDKEGVVSEACASELAENAAKIFQSDIGISFTGVAGPEELEGKPAGTVFIGISIKGRPTLVKKVNLAGTRDAIRTQTVKHGCFYLLKLLSESQSA
ncbi:competence/damage-inducible protein A [Bacillus methanolicus]|uniref:Putative competence-damage inducible protein n=1 Tax=Bacillus methanolicus (strain MGA3 / ATCC 53907) TaxID=796606 RepID=I3DZI5_BACMM|nr:competence/damage-inducible protein A [Bacillus methanolicus]AIE59725.1 Putative competence-damage inducible protein [Bacillus methanolicus MGA3]EIJ79656.1 competence damage-inducible protein A [Bacillus methanolicus MGA3]